MLLRFKTIRKSLHSEGSIGKYLKFALEKIIDSGGTRLLRKESTAQRAQPDKLHYFVTECIAVFKRKHLPIV